jgi:hypothetical protein
MYSAMMAWATLQGRNMQLGDFEQYVSDVIHQGDTLDAFITAEVRKAALWMERNNTFVYMENYRAFAISSGATEVPFTSQIKRVDMFRQVLDDGEFRNFEQIHPTDIDKEDVVALGTPHLFWINGNAGGIPKAVLNMEAPEDLSVQMIEVLFTTWPTGAASEPWLLKYGEDALLQQTLFQIALLPRVRDQEMAQMAKVARDEAINTLLGVDDELRASVRSEEMRFGRET